MENQDVKPTEQQLADAVDDHLEMVRVYERFGYMDAGMSERVQARILQEQLDSLQKAR